MSPRVADVAELNPLPSSSIVLVVERTEYASGRTHTFTSVWQRTLSGWLEMNPADRDNGERVEQAEFLFAKANHFGAPSHPEGSVLLLWNPEVTDLPPLTPEDAEQVPAGGLVYVTYPDDAPRVDAIFRSEGAGKWVDLDPADPYDGDDTAATDWLYYCGGAASLIYLPGQEG